MDVPDVLNKASAESHVIFVIPNMAGFSNELAVLKQTYNIPIPELDDALGSFKTETGMVNGVNDEGSLIVILPDLTSTIVEDTKPDFVLLMPVSDYNQFVANFQGSADTPLTTLTMPDGTTGFARSIDGYAVLGENRQVVENYTPAENADALSAKAGTLGRKYLGESELAIYFDIEAIAPTLKPKIDDAMEKMQQEMAISAAMMPDMMQSMDVIANMYGDALKAILDDATAVVVGLDISSNGIAFHEMVQFRDGSDLAGMFPGGEIQPVQFLKSLPDKPYIFAGAMDMAALDVGRLVDNILAALPEEGEGGAMLNIYRESLPLLKSTKSYAGAFYSPDPMAMMSGQMLNMVQVYRVDDGENYINDYKQQLLSLNEMQFPVGPVMGDEPPPMIKYETTFTDNVLQIEGAAVHQYQMVMDIPPEMIMQMGPTVMAMANIGGYIAAKDNHVVMTTVTDPKLITQSLQTIGANNGIDTTGGIAQVRSSLPAGLAFEGYVSPQGIADAVNVYLEMFLPEPLLVPDEIPPFAMGLGMQDNGLVFTFYAPGKTTKFIADTVQQITQDMAEQQQMMMEMQMEGEMPEDWMQEEQRPEQEGPPRAPR